MDTAKDARILVLEDAIRRLNEIVGNRKLKMHIDYSSLTDALKRAGSLLYDIKYSYLPAPQVANLEATSHIMEQFAIYRERLETAIKSSGYKPATVNDSLTLAEAFYSFRIGSGLKKRLQAQSDDPGLAIDILTVQVSQVQPLPHSKNLSECRCTDGSKIWRIVTNIPALKPGIKIPCAVLPPIEIMGLVSEAMFLGADFLPDETPLGLLEHPPEETLNQARAQVLQITKRMM